MFDIELELFVLNIRCRMPRIKSLNIINVKIAKNVSCCVGSVKIEIEKLKVAVTTYMYAIRGLMFPAKSLRQTETERITDGGLLFKRYIVYRQYR